MIENGLVYGQNFSKYDYLEQIIYKTDGVRASVWEKGKFLNKWGRNLSVGTSYELVGELQGSEILETHVSTNLIDSISSSDAADTNKTVVIEGQTIDGSGNLTFTVQSATTNGSDGRTKVTLSTPLARATRIYIANTGVFNTEQTPFAGTLYVYDDTDGVTNGVPNTASATKILLVAGERQSEKAATSISSQDYWFLEYLSASIGNSGGSAARVSVRFVKRDVKNGGIWRPIGRDIVLNVGQEGLNYILPTPIIINPNHDIRAIARTNANTAEVYAEFGGPLAKIIT